MSVDSKLRRAIYEAGLSLEQRGRKRVRHRVRQGQIELRYDGEHVEVGDLEDALEQIARWGKRVKWRRGGIVILVRGLKKVLVEAPLGPEGLTDTHYQAIDDLAEEAGLVALGSEPSNLSADVVGDVVGYFVDDNSITWCVFADGTDEVGYVRARSLELN